MAQEIKSRVLVIDDDRFLQENLIRLLTAEGYQASGVNSGEEALERLEKDLPDIVILDLGLPGMDGITTCRRIRKKWRMPLLMLTARSDAMDRVLGLETGADDYLTKPFAAMEFIARVRALLRRVTDYDGQGSEPTKKSFSIEGLNIDFERREVTVDGRLLELTTREFEVLAYLAANRDRAISRDQLFERVWGFDQELCTNSLDVHVYRIRKKVERDPTKPRYLHTVRGFGYKLGLNS